MTKWMLVFLVYAAPDNAVNWDGPWEIGMSRIDEETYDNEAECRNTGIRIKAGIQAEGMLAPIRFHCVRIEGSLPVGAQR